MRQYVLTVARLSFLIGGCSVYMAGKKEGTELSEILKCQTTICLEANGAEFIKDGEDNVQYYKLRKPTGSTGRACMHGTLDLFTLGIWEAAGTPIEGHYDKEKY